jgi:hypothetical protein
MVKHVKLKSNRILLNTGIMLFPFVIMIIINEGYRINKTNDNGIYKGLSTLNITDARKEKCTWKCHNNTQFCKTHHVTYLKNNLRLTDPIYYGIIRALKLGNAYALMNVVILVVLIPLSILIFIIKSINIQKQIIILTRNSHEIHTDDL